MDAARGRIARRPYFIGYAPWLGANFPIRLPYPDGECALAVLAVVHVAEVSLDLPRPEKLVRRRKKRQRPSVGFEDRQTIPRLQPYGGLIHRAAEGILLPSACSVAPDD